MLNWIRGKENPCTSISFYFLPIIHGSCSLSACTVYYSQPVSVLKNNMSLRSSFPKSSSSSCRTLSSAFACAIYETLVQIFLRK